MMNLLKKYIAKYVENIPVLAVVNVTANPDAPALVNYRCHHNTAWHLEHNDNVIAVAEGYYVAYGHIIAHFVCLQVDGSYMDPTLPPTHLGDKEFHIVKIHTSCSSHGVDNADDNLWRMKIQLRDSLPWPLRLISPNHF